MIVSYDWLKSVLARSSPANTTPMIIKASQIPAYMAVEKISFGVFSSLSFSCCFFMPDLLRSGFVSGNQTLPLEASGTLSPRAGAFSCPLIRNWPFISGQGSAL